MRHTIGFISLNSLGYPWGTASVAEKCQQILAVLPFRAGADCWTGSSSTAQVLMQIEIYNTCALRYVYICEVLKFWFYSNCHVWYYFRVLYGILVLFLCTLKIFYSRSL